MEELKDHKLNEIRDIIVSLKTKLEKKATGIQIRDY